MTTIDSPPVAPLLERLFADADASTPLAAAAFSALPEGQMQRLMQSKDDYRALYAGLKALPLPVTRETGRLLYMLARAVDARTIVEFGTSFGLSTLHLAAALRDNGGGRIITTEFEPSKIAVARVNVAAGDLTELVEYREGDALMTLASDLPATIDLLFLDGAKSLYGDILALVESRLRSGALIVADNADYCPEYVAHVRSVGRGYMSIPVGDDVELSIRL